MQVTQCVRMLSLEVWVGGKERTLHPKRGPNASIASFTALSVEEARPREFGVFHPAGSRARCYARCVTTNV